MGQFLVAEVGQINSVGDNGSKPTQKGDVCRWIGRTKGGLNSKLHGVCDGSDRPIQMLLTQGQVSDYDGARQLLP